MSTYVNMSLLRVLESGGVERFHAFPGISGGTIAEHQWGVALIAHWLYPDGSKDMLLRCLTHDCAERVTGDLPSQTKSALNRETAALSQMESSVEEDMGVSDILSAMLRTSDPSCDMSRRLKTELRVVAYADSLEGMFYCADRYLMGEKRAARCYSQWEKSVVERMDSEKDEELKAKVHQLYRNIHHFMETGETTHDQESA